MSNVNELTGISTPVAESPAPGEVEQVGPLGEQYKITTPKNPQYTGKVYGVAINEGKGMLNIETLDPKVGLTVAQIIENLKHMPGYVVRKVG